MMYMKMAPTPGYKTFNNLLENLVGDFEKTMQHATKNVLGSNSHPVNIVETDQAFHLELLAPGRKKEQFGLKVENDTLFIHYEPIATETAPEEKTRQIRREFTLSKINRSFQLEKQIATENILAKYEDGILKLFLPKVKTEITTATQITVE